MFPKCEPAGSSSCSKTQLSKQIYTQVSSIFWKQRFACFPKRDRRAKGGCETGVWVEFTWQGLLKIASWKHMAKLNSSRGGKSRVRGERAQNKAGREEQSQQRLKLQASIQRWKSALSAILDRTCAAKREAHRHAYIDAQPTLEGREHLISFACGGMWLLIRRQKIFLRTETACLNPA